MSLAELQPRRADAAPAAARPVIMRQYELVEKVQAYNPNADEALLNKAYVYAMQKHGTQKRASGDPYFNHPLEVAAILTDLKLDDATIAVGLLHDTIEDTDATRAEIDQGGLAGQGLELMYFKDPVDVFFMQVQGSGRVELPDGAKVRVSYDGKNGYPYTSIGRALIASREISAEVMSLKALKQWLRANVSSNAYSPSPRAGCRTAARRVSQSRKASRTI